MSATKIKGSTSATTNETTREILKHLYSLGVFAWRQNTLPIPLPGGGFRPAAKTGLPDVIAILPPRGRFCAIEVKTGRDRLRPEQEGFLANVEHMGGLTMVVKDFEDFVDKFPMPNN
jgi:hypothetical protein